MIYEHFYIFGLKFLEKLYNSNLRNLFKNYLRGINDLVFKIFLNWVSYS